MKGGGFEAELALDGAIRVSSHSSRVLDNTPTGGSLVDKVAVRDQGGLQLTI